MSSSSTKPKRYFVNTLPDYDGAPIPLERELWVERCRDTVQRVFTHQGTGFDDCDGGLYVGVAGVAFMAHRVAQSPHFAGDRARLLTKAQTYLGHALSYCDQPQVRADRAMQSAFLLGSAGVWALAAVVANEVGRNDDCDNFLARYAAVADICVPVKFLDCGSDEMFVGRAGYLTGLLYLRSRLGREEPSAGKHRSRTVVEATTESLPRQPYGNSRHSPLPTASNGTTGTKNKRTMVRSLPTENSESLKSLKVLPDEKIALLLHSVVQSGREYAKKHRSPCPLMYAYYDVEYLGAAHGLSSILMTLLHFPWFVAGDQTVERDIRASVDFLLHVQTPRGNFPCDLEDVTKPRRSQDELIHWCHGAPGVMQLMAKAYLTWQDPRYLESCLRSGQMIWERGLLRKGPGICHGIGGSGYAFLLLYRLTTELRWLHRARQFAEFMFTDEFKQARTPDCPYSLFEGLAGTACFLADLLEPRSATFPLIDPF
ncbi:lanC-like protein 3 isoform X1 [Dermacentor albipictus]|uniref:lanC-like protein 3 isoform X1 n=1 Tax=Dermacentor albipictus TaxID=60249 RepID=UPI0031FCFA8C